MFMQSIGDRVRAIRKAKGLTQEQLALLLKRPTSYVTRFESNEFMDPKVGTVKRFAKALGITVSDFLSDDFTIQPAA
jgi:transcriptional regulator with XRE-family HTH domain